MMTNIRSLLVVEGEGSGRVEQESFYFDWDIFLGTTSFRAEIFAGVERMTWTNTYLRRVRFHIAE